MHLSISGLPLRAKALMGASGFAALALFLTACSTTPKAAPAATTTVPNPPCPLTGTPASTPQVPQRPAVAIKVDAVPAARPQSGLDKADIVFEEPVEGSLTRYVAVFQCQDASLVGDIRSARAADGPIADELSKPLFVHAGGIDPIISMLGSSNLYDDNIFWHTNIEQNPPGRVAPFDDFTSTSAVWALQPQDTTPPAPIFSYSVTLPAGGTPAVYARVPFNPSNGIDNTWAWDASSQRWLLSFAGTPAVNADGTRTSFTNVVIQTVSVSYGPWIESGCCALEAQPQMTGTGPLIVLRNGEEITGSWQRASLSVPTTLLSTSGAPIALAPGPTWVEVVPSSVGVTVTP